MMDKLQEYIRKEFERITGSGYVHVFLMPEIEGIGVVVPNLSDHYQLWIQTSGSDDDAFVFYRSDSPTTSLVIPLMAEVE
jgi:hypothetical protein